MLRRTISIGAVCAVLAFAPATIMPTTDAFAQERPEAPTNDYWWPDQLDLKPLRDQTRSSDPMEGGFDYASAVAKLDVDALKADLRALMRDSQDWWPADYGHYGPMFVRLSWHAAGTYRTFDGRGGAGGGQQRFAPLGSWPDNANLDKARRLLWPIKQKYGRQISWSDLLVLAGNLAMEDMGFKTLGFAFGREDDWEPEEVNWGFEKEWLEDNRRYDGDGDRDLAQPLGASQMGLIYVNPEGPGGNNDPVAAAADIRATFYRMAMNDEEIVALIAGGHTFGKVHGAVKAAECIGPDPEAAPIEQQGLGWKNSCGAGNASDTTTSGLEGSWTADPARWTHQYLTFLFNYDWVQTKSPAGATQWIPSDESAADLAPDAHDPNKRHAPIMLTTDLTMKMDPGFRKISQRFLENPEEFEQAYARAWFKLLHRDMGPVARYVGPDVPEQQFVWQDPIPEVDYKLVDSKDIRKLKKAVLDSDLTVPELVRTAWASASSFRGTDMRGGANGARIRMAPMKDWEVNSPDELARVLGVLEGIQEDFNDDARGNKRISLADMIVLAGAAAIEKAAADAGVDVTVPFQPGRNDATAEQTDQASFNDLKMAADGFRNYYTDGDPLGRGPAEMLVEKADMLTLTVPEMTVLVGGMRALDANTGGADHGVFTDAPGTLTNDFFVNVLSMDNKWEATDEDGIYAVIDRASGDTKWTATEVDLVFGSNSELRAVTQFYAADDAKEQFVKDFVSAWTKVMQLDRFDLKRQS